MKILITIIVLLLVIGVYQFMKIHSKDKFTAEDYRYMSNMKIIQNKEMYGMYEIQKAQQEIDLYLAKRK